MVRELDEFIKNKRIKRNGNISVQSDNKDTGKGGDDVKGRDYRRDGKGIKEIEVKESRTAGGRENGRENGVEEKGLRRMRVEKASKEIDEYFTAVKRDREEWLEAIFRGLDNK